VRAKERIMLDATTKRAICSFLDRIAGRYDIAGAIVYGSRARGDHREDSDADLAVLVRGPKNTPLPDVWELGTISTEVLLDTGVVIQVTPIRLEDWDHPERFSNPFLLENIRREGVPLWPPAQPT
jgi:predicted nucleotidyltransferase